MAWTTNRNTEATYFDGAGVLQTAAALVARPNFIAATQNGYISEAAATNLVPTTITPSSWQISAAAGTTVTLSGTGVENGITYGEFTVSGSNTAGSAQYPGFSFFTSANPRTPAVSGNAFTATVYAKIVSTTRIPTNGIQLQFNGVNSSGNYFETPGSATINTTSAAGGLGTYRVIASGTMANAGTTQTNSLIQYVLAAAETVGFVLRLGMPQLEIGLTATSAITTRGTATLRTLDAPFNNAVGVGPQVIWFAAYGTPITTTPPVIVSPAFYVAPSGSNAAAGTAGAPFATLAQAQTAMRGNSTKTVYVRGGTYNLTSAISMNSQDNGTAWLGYPGETAILDGGGTVVDLFFIDAGTLNGTIDHLTIRNTVNSAIHLNGYRAVGNESTITGWTISNNTIQYVTPASTGYGAGNTGGIRGSYATASNIVKNNLISDTYGPSISFVAGDANQTIAGNQITYNKCYRANNTGQTDSGAIYLLDVGHNAISMALVLIDYNYIENAGTGTNIRHIYLDDEASYATVSNNICTGTGSSALQLHGSDHVTISNNIFDITAMAYVGLYQDDVSSGHPNYGMDSNIFQKNIIYCAANFPSSTLWAFINGSGGTIATPADSNNLYYTTGPALPNSGTIIDTAPQVGNPLFTDAAGRNYSHTGTVGINLIGFTAINQALMGPR